jgi:antitoxin component YwqK of YwqJK toxin-antitoxin module
MRNGEIKIYYKNGNLREVSYFKDDKLEGESKWYYVDGKLGLVSNWKNGNREGECKTYLSDGRIEITYYKDDINITEKVLAKRELLDKIINLKN